MEKRSGLVALVAQIAIKVISGRFATKWRRNHGDER